MPRSASPPPERERKRKGLLKEKLHMEKIKGPDGRTRFTIAPIDEQLTFDKGFYVFIRALQLLKSHNEGVVLVGLGGASGSGKTAFSERVKGFMPGLALISMDNYNDASKLIDGNFDDPRLTDYDLLLSNLTDLKAGRPAEIPIYDFKQSRRSGYQHLPVPASRIVVIEGIYALSERLRPLLDLRVSITGGVHFDLVKRVMRDITRSGQGPEEIIQQITDTVYPMYKAFIEPDLKTAQLRIYNSFNPFAGLMDAAHILKSKKIPDVTEETVMRALGPGTPPPRREEMYDIHLLPPNEDPETCQSWLRMRNRDGRYTLMFEEWVTEGPFIISPRITFEVSVRVLGGLMALGYEIGTIMRRRSVIFTKDDITVKLDDIENLGEFMQVHSKDRDHVTAVARALGMTDFIPRSYIEQVQLGKLTNEFQNFSDDVRKRFSVDAESLLEDGFLLGNSPRHGGLSIVGPRGAAAIAALARRRGATQRANAGGGAAGLNGGGGGAPAGVGGGSPVPLPPLAALSSSAPVRGGSSGFLSALIAAGGGGGGGPGSAGTASPIAIPAPGSRGLNGGSSAAGGGGGSQQSLGASPGASGDLGSPLGPGRRGLVSDLMHRESSDMLEDMDGIEAPQQQPQPPSLLQLPLALGSRGGPSGERRGVFGTPGPPGQQQQQQQRHSARHPGEPNGGGSRGRGNNGGGGSSGGAINGGDGGGGGFSERVAQQLEVLGEGVRRYSSVSLQLDAMIHHQRALNEGVASLAAAAEALKHALEEQKQQQQRRRQGGGGGGEGPLAGAFGGSGSKEAAIWMGAGAACLGLGLGLGLLMAGRR